MNIRIIHARQAAENEFIQPSYPVDEIEVETGEYYSLSENGLSTKNNLPLTAIAILPPIDVTKPYLLGNEYGVTSDANQVCLQFSRPGPYVVKYTYSSNDGSRSVDLYQCIYVDTGRLGPKKGKVGAKVRKKIRDADLILISSSPNDATHANLAARLVYMGRYQDMDSVQDAAAKIRAFATGHPGQPFKVLIIDHGAPANMSMGGGDKTLPGKYLAFNDPITALDEAVYTGSLIGLPITNITWMGCSVAETDEGKQFIQHIADSSGIQHSAFDTEVMYSTHIWYGARWWIGLGGHIWSATPNGNLLSGDLEDPE